MKDLMPAIGEFLLFPLFILARIAGVLSQVIEAGWKKGRED